MRPTFTLVASAALVAFLASAPPVMAQQKTIKQCRDEWNANKVAMEASGQTQRAFVAQCRGVPLAERTARAAAELTKGQYAIEAEAKTSCRNDAVVWVNRRSMVYHDSSSRSYGATRTGAYMCQKDSIAGGFRAPKTAKEPGKQPAKAAAKPAAT
jgi:hypothetical protein